MFRYWFTRPCIGKAIYTNDYELVKNEPQLHSFSDEGLAICFLGNDTSNCEKNSISS